MVDGRPALRIEIDADLLEEFRSKLTAALEERDAARAHLAALRSKVRWASQRLSKAAEEPKRGRRST
jgi:hypothetical protein